MNRLCFGNFYRRPSENLLHRLTDCWQLSQPLHLRHFAIVRDSDIQKTIIFYRNFSRRNFAKRVEEGEASWEAVETSLGNNKKGKSEIPGPEATVELDQYGFPLTPSPKGLLKHGNATLYEGLVSCNPSGYGITSHDPTVAYANGEYCMLVLATELTLKTQLKRIWTLTVTNSYPGRTCQVSPRLVGRDNRRDTSRPSKKSRQATFCSQVDIAG